MDTGLDWNWKRGN